MVLTRDVPAGYSDAGNATGPLPEQSGYGLPDGDSNAGVLDGVDANGAASPDATEPVDPFADIPPDLLTQHERMIVEREAEVRRQQIAELHQIKNREQRNVNKVNVRLQAQAQAREAYIRQNAERWGLGEGDLAILTNSERTAGDAAEARYEATAQRYDQQLGWANERLNSNLDEFLGPAPQRAYNPWSDATFTGLWSAAQQQLGRWVMAGEPEDVRFVNTQRAFDAVRSYLQAKGGPVTQQQQAPAGNGQRTPPSAADQRARQAQRGPNAPARTGGTGSGGQGMDEQAAWDQARREHPDDPKLQFRRSLRLQEGGAG